MAQNIHPPLHPSFPYPPEQSTNYYSENEVKFLFLMKLNPSSEPVVEKAQHDPHCPWFLMPVTAPYALQSTDAGKSFGCSSTRVDSVSETAPPFKQLMCFENSAVVMSEN